MVTGTVPEGSRTLPRSMKWSLPGKPGAPLALSFDSLRSLAQDDPLIFRQNLERVAPVHGRGTSRGVEVVECNAVDGEDVAFIS